MAAAKPVQIIIKFLKAVRFVGYKYVGHKRRYWLARLVKHVQISQSQMKVERNASQQHVERGKSRPQMEVASHVGHTPVLSVKVEDHAT